MYRLLTLTIAATSLAYASIASAQVVSYHHRSTVYGDHMAGYAEAVDAEGRNIRNRSEAYKTFIAALREREVLRRERIDNARYEDELVEQDINERAAKNRERARAEVLELDQNAQYLLKDIQSRRHIWRGVLADSQYAAHRLQIESILSDWDTGYPGDRKSLELLVDVLRNDLARRNISHLTHREAVETLEQLKSLSLRRDYHEVQAANSRLPQRLQGMLAATK